MEIREVTTRAQEEGRVGMDAVAHAFHCAVCDSEPVWSWTDTHGVAQCHACGTPYRILHYEQGKHSTRRVDKPPEIYVRAEYISLCRQYWRETHKRAPGHQSFPGGQELATAAETKAFHEWMLVHAPASPDATASTDTDESLEHRGGTSEIEQHRDGCTQCQNGFLCEEMHRLIEASL